MLRFLNNSLHKLIAILWCDHKNNPPNEINEPIDRRLFDQLSCTITRWARDLVFFALAWRSSSTFQSSLNTYDAVVTRSWTHSAPNHENLDKNIGRISWSHLLLVPPFSGSDYFGSRHLIYSLYQFIVYIIFEFFHQLFLSLFQDITFAVDHIILSVEDATITITLKHFASEWTPGWKCGPVVGIYVRSILTGPVNKFRDRTGLDHCNNANEGRRDGVRWSEYTNGDDAPC